jgi:hypothetical protein
LIAVFVVPLALICAPLRHIPLRWITVDSSFGVFGAIPRTGSRVDWRTPIGPRRRPPAVAAA